MTRDRRRDEQRSRFRFGVSFEALLQMAVLACSIIGGAYIMNYRVDRLEAENVNLQRELKDTEAIVSKLSSQVTRLNDSLIELNRLLYEKKLIRSLER